jgi:hypothetical protein
MLRSAWEAEAEAELLRRVRRGLLDKSPTDWASRLGNRLDGLEAKVRQVGKAAEHCFICAAGNPRFAEVVPAAGHPRARPPCLHLFRPGLRGTVLAGPS